MPIVSVIIPTYKRNDSLKRAIESVLYQTFNDIEVIVVDDNNENTEYRKKNEILMKRYQNNPKVVYLKHTQNKNGSAARNTGIRYSKAKYIAFLDDDDEFVPEKVEKQVKLLEQIGNKYGGVYSGYAKYFNNEYLYKNTQYLAGDLRKQVLLKECPISGGVGSTMLVKRELLNEINGWDETFTRHQDYEMVMRIFQKKKMGMVNEALTLIHLDDTSNMLDPVKFLKMKKLLLSKYKSDLELFPKRIQNEIYKRHYIEIAKTFGMYHYYPGLIKFIQKSKSYASITLMDILKIGFYTLDSYINIKFTILKILMKLPFREKLVKLLGL